MAFHDFTPCFVYFFANFYLCLPIYFLFRCPHPRTEIENVFNIPRILNLSLSRISLKVPKDNGSLTVNYAIIRNNKMCDCSANSPPSPSPKCETCKHG
jgi:hypothetical protein